MRKILAALVIAACVFGSVSPASADLTGTWTGKLKCVDIRNFDPSLRKVTIKDYSIDINRDATVGGLETGTVSGVRARFLACDQSGTYKYISDGKGGIFQYLSDPGGTCGSSITQTGIGLAKEGKSSKLTLNMSMSRNDGSASLASCKATLKR
jgi:hypothetical protein